MLYLAKKVPGRYKDGDMLLEEFPGEKDGVRYIIRRSCFDDSVHSIRRSENLGRVRAKVQYEGYVLHPLGRNETRVVYLQNVDPGCTWRHLVVNKVFLKMLCDTVDDLLVAVDDEKVNSSFGVFGEDDEDIEMTEMSAEKGKFLMKKKSCVTLGGASIHRSKNPLVNMSM